MTQIHDLAGELALQFRQSCGRKLSWLHDNQNASEDELKSQLQELKEEVRQLNEHRARLIAEAAEAERKRVQARTSLRDKLHEVVYKKVYRTIRQYLISLSLMNRESYMHTPLFQIGEEDLAHFSAIELQEKCRDELEFLESNSAASVEEYEAKMSALGQALQDLGRFRAQKKLKGALIDFLSHKVFVLVRTTNDVHILASQLF